MIPKELLHQKPIDLRHICLFYLGHMCVASQMKDEVSRRWADILNSPTFLDIHLTRLTKGRHTEPEYFKDIFERGIDPDVDDPTQCHVSIPPSFYRGVTCLRFSQDHSEVPTSEEDWPTLTQILDFRDRVRQRLLSIYSDLASGKMPLDRHAGRVLFMGFEHEAMHAETLLYMLAQSPLTRTPTAVKEPQWELLREKWDAAKVENKVLIVKAGEILMGHNDAEKDDEECQIGEFWADHEFGWDNEHPHISQQVKTFKVDALPVSNNDYLSFLSSTGAFDNLKCETAPASWVNTSQTDTPEWKIRTFYGPVGFDVGGNWPLMASKLELDDFAKWKGGRLPTEAELRKLWESEEGPRVNGTVNNVGVKNWHPVP